jgi:WD40 repeat protein
MEINLKRMKKLFTLLLFITIVLQTHAQQSLDSLRLVLPVGHSNSISCAVFSPDGKLALTASEDNTARIYEVTSGKELTVLSGHSDRVYSAVFSPNGKLALTVGKDGLACIWDVVSGKELKVISLEVSSAVFSPDGKLVLIVSWDGTVHIHEVTSGKWLKTFKVDKGYFGSAVFSPDGKLALTKKKHDNTAHIYDEATGKELKVLRGHTRIILSAVFSQDGKLALTASVDSTSRIWDVASGRELQVLRGHTRAIGSAVFSPDGKLALTASVDSTTRIWDISTGKELHLLSGHTDDITSAVFSPDGKLVLTASLDKTARIYEVSSGKELLVLSRPSIVNSAVFSPSGKQVLTAGGNSFDDDEDHIPHIDDDNTARIYETATGKELQVLSGNADYVYSASFSPDSKRALTASWDNTARIWDVTSGKELQMFSGHKDVVESAEFSPNGKLVFTESYDNTGRIWDVVSGKELKVIIGGVYFGVFSPDGKLLLTVSHDSIGRIWDVFSGKELQVLNDNIIWIRSAVFSADAKMVLTTDHNLKGDSIGRIWDVASGRELQVLRGHTSLINSLEFSPDGKLALTASWDNTTRIWDVASGKELQVLIGNKGMGNVFDGNSGVFSPDGKLALTLYGDATAHIYEVASGKELQVLRGHTGFVYFAVFSSDGKLALTKSWDGTARIYEVASGKELKVLDWHTNLVISKVFSKDAKFGLTMSTDQKTILWDIATGKPIYERIQLLNNNWLVKLPNSPYYMCSKDASKMLHYVTPSLKVIGFEQLDPVYNRPDIVLDSIGKYFNNDDEGRIDEYRKAWEKRIDRLGLDKEKLGKGEIAVPNAEIVGADEIAYESKDGKLEINVSANDSKYPLRRFNVFVNEVPLYGSTGISIAHLKKQVWDTTVSVPLSVGDNKIQVSVMNELGLENFKYPTYVNYTPKEEVVSKTYFIGIGVNEFKDATHNLTFCEQDVRDLASAFSGKHTETTLLTNEQVTKEKILSLKELLQKTTVNDKVIISCSSHGLLDDSLNFYLATYDVDFEHPKSRGLRYEELEGLLDGIPARQKLLLLDACNSGENDKLEAGNQVLAQNQATADSTKIGRGAKAKYASTDNQKFIQMNELFVNVRNNTGSVIISAAGGQQSALEGEAVKVDGKAIQNGAFTFSILECLEQNKGKELKVNALKQYAEKRVEEITKGKQKPTSRQETMEIDWDVR